MKNFEVGENHILIAAEQDVFQLADNFDDRTGTLKLLNGNLDTKVKGWSPVQSMYNSDFLMGGLKVSNQTFS